MVFNVLHQSPDSLLDQLKHGFKVLGAALIGIRDIFVLEPGKKIKQKNYFPGVLPGRTIHEIAQIIAIHRHYIVERFKVGRTDLSGSQGTQIDPSAVRDRPDAAVRRLPDMPIARTCRIDGDFSIQSGITDEVPKQPFGRRRPANIAQTNKENFDHEYENNPQSVAPL